MQQPNSPVAGSSGNFPEQQPIDRSASGLAYQSYKMASTAKGVLGVGQRTVPPADAQFSNPPISRSQFGGDSNAKATFTPPEGM